MSVEDWAEIRRLYRSEGMPIKAIARVMGVGRNTVRRALESDGRRKYRRASRGSLVDAVEPQIRELLRAWPTMSATVIAARIGWLHSLTILKTECASCGRCICRRTRPDARSMWPASWRRVTCGSRRRISRWGMGSKADRRCW